MTVRGKNPLYRLSHQYKHCIFHTIYLQTLFAFCRDVYCSSFSCVLTCKCLQKPLPLAQNAYSSHTKGINMVCSRTMQHSDLNNEALSWYFFFNVCIVFTLLRIPRPLKQFVQARGAAVILDLGSCYITTILIFSSHEPGMKWHTFTPVAC